MRLSVAIALCCLCSLSFAADPAHASIKKNTRIPSEGLSAALESLAKDYDLQLLYRTEVVKDLKTQGASGSLTSDEALTKVLSGTGLTYKYLDAQTVTLIPIAAITGSTTTDQVRADSGNKRDDAKEAGKNSSQEFLVAQVAQTPDQSSTVEQGNGQKGEDSEQLQEVVVTGTLIHHVAPITPVMTITQADLIGQGYTTLADAIFDLPQNFQGAGTSPSSNVATGLGGPASANNLSYASGINLRGLGGNATLVLLNGRRLAPTAFGGTVDISQIPVSVIDRVEILTDGASALYGSDAVAGVVNIITRREFSGFEIGGRSTSISDGKTPDYGADMVGGYSWNGGGFVASADYQKDNPLFARNRSFTNTLPDPWALSPQDQAEHGYLSVNQQFTEQLKFSMDTLLTHRDYEAQNNLYTTPTPYVGAGRTDQYNVSPELDYSISRDWTASLIGQWSKEQDANFITDPPPFASVESFPIDYEVISAEPRIDGKLFDLPGGAMRAALGGQWREEKLDYSTSIASPGTPTTGSGFDATRHVISAYGELAIPIVGPGNAIQLVRELRIDVSGRYDHYSDFGGTTNPKVEIGWAPVNDVKIHGSFARSFQAPTLYNLAPNSLYAAVAPSADPTSPSGSSLGIANISQGNPNLEPQTAKSFNAGVTYSPSSVPGLKLEVSYFSIDFDNEITYLWQNPFCVAAYCTSQDQADLGSLFQRNPSLTEVNAILNNPAYTVYNWAAGNYAPAPYTASDIKFLANIGEENAAATSIRGLDLTPRYVGPETAYGRFRADLDASYFTTYRERVTSGSPAIDIDNLTYSPLRFRAKANFGWEKSGWATNIRVNFANAYQNSIDPSCSGGGCTISSWTTVDLGLSYTVPKEFQEAWLGGTRVAITASNIFDRPPPFVSTGTVFSLYYDPVNASALMRSVAVTFTKRWGG